MRLTVAGMSFLCCLFLFALSCARHDVYSDEVKGSVNINTSRSVEDKTETYGFNTNQYNGFYLATDPDFVEHVSALKPRLLRFPGGSESNIYHWKISDFIDSEVGSTLNKALNETHWANVNRLRSRDARLSFDDFMALCDKIGAKAIVVVNLYTGTPEESAEWVAYARDKGYKVSGWELGNELYLESYRNRFSDPAEYMRVARQHAELMRAEDPGIKISVPAAPVGFHLSSLNDESEYEKLWNKALASEGFYEAYTVHFYSYEHKSSLLSFEHARGFLFASSDIAFKQAVDYYESLFGNKEMWVTEWNITNPRNRFANTQLHAMYCGDFFLNLLESRNITKASFHVLASGSQNGFSVFSPSSDINALDPVSRSTVKRSCYPVFELIGQHAGSISAIYPVESFSSGAELMGKLEFSGRSLKALKAVTASTQGGLVIFIANRSDNDIPVTLSVDGKAVEGNIRYKYVANKRLEATNLGNSQITGSEAEEVFSREWTGQASRFVAAANSFGVIELDPAE